MKNHTYVSLGWLGLPALATLCLLCLSPLQAALPPAAPAMAPAPFADQLPESWGDRGMAARPAPAQAQERPSNALVALPEPKTLSRMPVGRVQVGKGRIDPEQAMQRTAFYVIRAQAAGIVEYLYTGDGLTRAGQPLVRLYDLAILSDLRIGESAMSRFANGPFVIAPRLGGMPPLPPVDFPKPTAIQRLLGIRPFLPPPTVTAQRATSPGPRADLSAQAPEASLTPANGLAALPPAPAVQRKSPQGGPPGRSVTRLTGDLSEAHERVSELTQSLAKIDRDLDGAQEDLSAAKDDAAARERLYNQGVLARNVYEAAQAKVGALQDEVQSLQGRRTETAHGREMAVQRVATLQDQLDVQVSQAKANATLAERDEAVVRQPSAHQEPVAVPYRRAVAPAARGNLAAAREEAFPSPTRRARPELQRLPRLRSSSRVAMQSQSEIPSVPLEVKRLAEPRWTDQTAPGDGLVIRQIVPQGAQVKPGQPLLEVANREWARVYSDIDQKDVANFPKGAPVRVSFDSYPGVTLEGFINSVEPVVDTGLARVEMVVVAREGYCPEDTYASLEWLVLAAPLTEIDEAEALAPAVEELTATNSGKLLAYDLFPIVPLEVVPTKEIAREVKQDEYVGLLRLGEMDAQAAAAKQNPINAMRLSKLHKWRDSFTAGMTTGIFGSLILTYPRDNEIGQAVERLASARVSHAPNRCARTMREALGWGLGDAAMWLNRLPERGYVARKDGLARPGDILVWPFTYGPRRTQHIGVAVNQAGKLMLLSNLGGTLGTVELSGGYVAFYKPTTAPAAKAQTAARPATSKPGHNL